MYPAPSPPSHTPLYQQKPQVTDNLAVLDASNCSRVVVAVVGVASKSC